MTHKDVNERLRKYRGRERGGFTLLDLKRMKEEFVPLGFLALPVMDPKANTFGYVFVYKNADGTEVAFNPMVDLSVRCRTVIGRWTVRVLLK